MNTLWEKFQKKDTPIILCADIDGTIFTAGWKVIFAPFWNLRTAVMLKNNSIPLILVTGRSGWSRLEDFEINLHGLPKADIVITSAGATMYHRLSDGSLQKDFEWEKRISELTIDKTLCINTILSYCRQKGITIQRRKNTTYLMRFFLPKVHASTLSQIKKDLENLLPKNLQVIFTDKLLYRNTEKLFAGDMLIAPKIAGKDNALRYILEHMQKTPFSAYLFGDALIDLPMLSLPSTKSYTVNPFLVHPTPLAKKETKEITSITILDSDGPQAIFSTMEKAVSQFSPAQNSRTRSLLLPFEGLLDSIIDKKLSPNEVSFLGLTKVKQGVDQVYLQKNLLKKIQGVANYLYGMLCDMLDGIRARRSGRKEPNGQLVDGYCDRAEEFYQLFTKYKKHKNETILFTALSCVLPSIARAQAEIQNTPVPETDAKGGSRSSRVKKLFIVLLLDILNAHKSSQSIVHKMYSNNIATFTHRLSFIQKNKQIPIATKFQKEAQERFLLYTQLFQEEIAIVKEYIPKESLEKWIKENKLENYLKLDIIAERKKNGFKDYNLSIRPNLLVI